MPLMMICGDMTEPSTKQHRLTCQGQGCCRWKAKKQGRRRTAWMRPMIFCSPTPLAMPWKRLSMRCSRLHLHSAFISTQAYGRQMQSFPVQPVRHSQVPQV